MQRFKDAAKVLKIYPKLKLGEKLEGGGVKSLGPKKVKITAEPSTTVMIKNGKQVKAFKLIVEEGGELKKWLIPMLNEEGEGHYLVDQLQDVEVGEVITLEMKKRGPRNYIEITREGAENDQKVVEDEDEVPGEHDAEDPDRFKFEGEQ